MLPEKFRKRIFIWVRKFSNSLLDRISEFYDHRFAARGTFTVDPVNGVVQTALKHYKPGETYRIFVQARDRTPTDPEVSQVKTEVALS